MDTVHKAFGEQQVFKLSITILFLLCKFVCVCVPAHGMDMDKHEKALFFPSL